MGRNILQQGKTVVRFIYRPDNYSFLKNLTRFIAQRLRHTHGASFSKTVTRIGVGSIAVGVAVMIVAVSVLLGFKTAIQEKLFALNGQLNIRTAGLNVSFEESPMPVSAGELARFRNRQGVEEVSTVAHKAGIIKTPDALQGVLLKGVGADFNWKRFSNNIVEGRIPNFDDSLGSKEILLSKAIANQLQIKAGESVTMYFLQNPPRVRKLLVTGLYETGLEELDKQLIIGDLLLIQRLNNWGTDTVGAYQVFLKNFDEIASSAKNLETILGPTQRLSTIDKEFKPLFDWLGLLDRNLVIFLVLIFTVASFNMVSILLVLIMERTTMLGLMKTLGASHTQLRSIFLWQGFLMTIRGLFLGNAIGLGISFFQAKTRWIPLDPENYYISYVPMAFHWPSVLLINALTLGFIVLVLVLPTRILLRIKPIAAIRFAR